MTSKKVIKKVWFVWNFYFFKIIHTNGYSHKHDLTQNIASLLHYWEGVDVGNEIFFLFFGNSSTPFSVNLSSLSLFSLSLFLSLSLSVSLPPSPSPPTSCIEHQSPAVALGVVTRLERGNRGNCAGDQELICH
uniref:Uncharacterized protein n=1 Tax=Micrurus lemniscatus lemniscatus TaxID=129467 RepID=A0A2D4IG90_MICLE